MRYEIKYVYPYGSEFSLAREIMTLPGVFREIYGERRVNNIYYDTPALNDYADSVTGAPRRSKIRVRWYGENIVSPALEHKFKRGQTGEKRSLPLNGFAAFHEDWPEEAGLIMSNRVPSLVNSYRRRYFATPDGACRITLDYDMKFWPPDASFTQTLGVEDERVVLEVKFSRENLPFVSRLTQSFARRVGKNSKYVSGIEAIIYGRRARL